MWHAIYTGPREDIANTVAPTWREAREAVVLQIKTIAPMNSYAALVIAATQEAKLDCDWSTTDGTHTFGLRKTALTIGDAVDTMNDTGLDAETVLALLLDDPLPDVHSEALTASSVQFQDDPRADENGWTGRKCPECGGYGQRLHLGDNNELACVGCGGTGDENISPGHTDLMVLPETIDAFLDANPLPDVDHTAREHSELGGSIVERFGNCAGSVRLVRGMPNPETPASKRGTAAHEVAHMCLLSGQDAIEYVGHVVNDIETDESIANGVQAYLDDCRACPADEVFYEVRFNLESLGPPAPMFGTADFVGYDALEQRLYVKDYKNGFKYVDALGNKQLRYYALGALLALGDGKPVSDIHVTICQPNALGATLKTDTFDAVELVEWAQWLMDAARKTQDPDAPATAGSWCEVTFCPARGSCSVRAAYALSQAQVEFADYLSPMRTPEVRLLSAAERGAIHGAADGLRAFLSAVEDSIKADTSGTGWKVVPTETRQAWRDKEAAAVTLRMDHGIDPYEPAEVISPAVARGKVKESLHAERVAQHTTGKKPTKKDAEADARVLLADLIADISSGTKLVPEADPRPALPSGGAEFDNVKV